MNAVKQDFFNNVGTKNVLFDLTENVLIIQNLCRSFIKLGSGKLCVKCPMFYFETVDIS